MISTAPTRTTTVITLTTILLGCTVLIHSKGIPSLKRNIRKHYTATVGSSVRLRCPVSGTKDPLHNRTLVTWYQGAQFIDNTLRSYSRFRLRAGKHLKIVNVRFEDAGIYTCRAYNQFGSNEINITLRIRNNGPKEARGEPPRFKLESRSSMTFRKGDTARLRCHSTGDPDPDVQWFKDNKPYGKNSKRAGVSASGWTLNLRYLTLQDTGIYMCRVSNKLGSINRTFVVRVKVRIPKPRIEEHDVTRVSVRRGRRVVIDCRAKSAGRPSFIWRRWSNDYNKLNSTMNVQKAKGFGTKYVIHGMETNNLDNNYFGTSLEITNVTKADQGKYSCFVKNKYGSDELAKYLFVIEKSTAEPWTPTGGVSTGQFQDTRSPGTSLVLIVVIVFIVLTIMSLGILIFCCRKQRKDLEKKYVINYQPEPFFHTEHDLHAANQEIQRTIKPPSSINSHSTTTPSKASHVTSTSPSNEPRDSDVTDDVQQQHESEATERRVSNTDTFDGSDMAVSRSSSERTLSVNTTSSREQFIDAKGGTDYTTKCHATCGEICRFRGQTNTTGKSDRDLRESMV